MCAYPTLPKIFRPAIRVSETHFLFGLFNPLHAEYFYVLHSSKNIILFLLICNIPVESSR